ncbi:serine protease family S08A [Thraustotheca clavata]|uniref:subtilisin n=1 Tax=Thraustotheca clavata TaxID=74557 RepID=A0A1V9ZNQ8_9STRA|nr:serine protease family S08A [Thraustotheca clavata]
MKLAIILSALAAVINAKITSSALRELEQNESFTAFITFKPNGPSPLEAVQSIADVTERRQALFESASTVAEANRQTLKEIVGDRPIKAFWITKACTVGNVDKALAEKIAKLDSVAKVDIVKTIKLNPVIKKSEDSPVDNTRPNGIQWGVNTVGAPEVWKNLKGEGVVIGSIDTGVRHTHEAIKSKWRQSKGWFDPYNQVPLPEDLGGHGTHTIGTMVGDFGIGVAPGAQFISCRGLYEESGTNAALLECAEFMICPTDPDGNHPDCKKGAHIVNNSWGGGPGTDTWYQDVVDAWQKAGITPIFANSNDGPACSTTGNPANYPNVISVGAIGSRQDSPTQLAYFSSKGPAQYLDNLGQVHTIIKPDVSAPGFFTYSAVNVSDSYYDYYAGTSMAAPHVAGVVALMKSAQKDLTFDEIKHYLTTTTEQKTLEAEPEIWKLTRNRTLPGAPNCGGVSDSSFPNNRYGYGRVNVAAILPGGKLPTIPTTSSPAPLPAPETIQLCNYNHNILSEWNGQLFVDTEKHNDNEKFWYNADDKSIQSQSNNASCLDVYQDTNGVNKLRLYTCTGNSAQKWGFEPNTHSIRSLSVRNLCLESAHATPGAAPFVADCTGGISQWFTKCQDAPAPKSYVKLVTKSGKTFSEYYTGLYANWASDTTNELFTYDSNAKTLQVASNGQCLDGFKNGDSYGLHTYACDANNANQKWIIDAANHKIKHATHNNLCLDVDPTNEAHSVQVWECHNFNTNQWIDAVLILLSALAAMAQAKVTSAVLRELDASDSTTVLVTFKSSAAANLESVAVIENQVERRQKFVETATEAATARTAVLKNVVDEKNIKSFWISRVASVANADKSTVAKIAALDNVEKVDVVRKIALEPFMVKDNSPTDHSRPSGIQWGVDTVGAPAIWQYTKGKGVVVGSIDTGARHTHEAIKGKWRQDHGWYDPYNQTALPVDIVGHGTHTIGTMTGDYGIGVAPDAQWISCRGLYDRNGDDASILNCAQFMICPTKTDGSDPDCTKGADVVNNSWGGDVGTDPWFQDVIDAWHMAGITPVFSNGNGGPACSTTGNPGSYANLISVGAVGSYDDEPDQLAFFSSKGPATYKSASGKVSTIVKPTVSAPGFFTYSSVNDADNYYTYYAGTSMAAPHVSGVVALMKSVQKGLTYNQIYSYLTTTTVQSVLKPEPDQWVLRDKNHTVYPGAPNCGGVSDATFPNNRYGYGRVNVTNILNGGKFPNPHALIVSAVYCVSLLMYAEAKVASQVHRHLSVHTTIDIFVKFTSHANALNSIVSSPKLPDHRQTVYDKLKDHSVSSQKQALVLLHGHVTKSFWIASCAIVHNASAEVITSLALLKDVIKIEPIHELQLDPVLENLKKTTSTGNVEWGVATIGAPEVWPTANGTGTVVGSIDTGVRHTHEALRDNWRQSRGWYDPYNHTRVPADHDGHGTHTTGTIVGRGGIGVAPGAQWIACKGLYKGRGTSAALLECAQFMMCPTFSDGSRPDCSQGVDIVNNSWGGATFHAWFEDAVAAWHKAGITAIFSIGNNGPQCASAGSPGVYPNVISVGAVGSHDNNPNQLAYFSAKGAATYIDHRGVKSVHVKPDVAAPGFFIRSARNTRDTSYAELAGTSMAAPHVSGIVALMKSAKPAITYDEIYDLLTTTTEQESLLPEPLLWTDKHNNTLTGAPNCNGTLDSAWPNNRYGNGMCIDASLHPLGLSTCNTSEATQKWNITNNQIRQQNRCVEASTKQSRLFVSECAENKIKQWFAPVATQDVSSIKPNPFVRLTTKRRQVLVLSKEKLSVHWPKDVTLEAYVYNSISGTIQLAVDDTMCLTSGDDYIAMSLCTKSNHLQEWKFNQLHHRIRQGINCMTFARNDVITPMQISGLTWLIMKEVCTSMRYTFNEMENFYLQAYSVQLTF